MIELTRVVLETETAFPMEIVGWGTLILSLLIVLAWLASLYR